MALTSEQMEAFRNHVGRHMGSGCMRCGNKSLGADMVVGLAAPSSLGGPCVPCVTVSCSQCGHVELISAMVAKVPI
jgi:predicted nucleic-acid-binding Zn-ribbon protein